MYGIFTLMVGVYGKLVGKYTVRPMDHLLGMIWYNFQAKLFHDFPNIFGTLLKEKRPKCFDTLESQLEGNQSNSTQKNSMLQALIFIGFLLLGGHFRCTDSGYNSNASKPDSFPASPFGEVLIFFASCADRTIWTMCFFCFSCIHSIGAQNHHWIHVHT